MHYLFRVLVIAENEKEAAAQAEQELSYYKDRVWDWYSLGGRFNENNNQNIINANHKEFWNRIKQCEENQKHNIHEYIKQAKRRLDNIGMDFNDLFNSYIEDDFVKEVRKASETKVVDSMVPWYLKKVLDIVDGETIPDSYFLISSEIYGGSKLPLAHDLPDRIRDNPEDYWLLTYDIHN